MNLHLVLDILFQSAVIQSYSCGRHVVPRIVVKISVVRLIGTILWLRKVSCSIIHLIPKLLSVAWVEWHLLMTISYNQILARLHTINKCVLTVGVCQWKVSASKSSKLFYLYNWYCYLLVSVVVPDHHAHLSFLHVLPYRP